jgi:hypothetical protein
MIFQLGIVGDGLKPLCTKPSCKMILLGLSKKAFFTENIGVKYSILVEPFHEMATF